MGAFGFKLCRLDVYVVILFDACMYFTRMLVDWKRTQLRITGLENAQVVNLIAFPSDIL